MTNNSKIPSGFKLIRLLPSHDDYIIRLRWSPDGTILASNSGDHTIRLWDFETGELLSQFVTHEGLAGNIAWSFDGKFIAASNMLQDGKIWNVKERNLHTTLQDSKSIDMEYHPNGQYLAVYGRSKINILTADSLTLVKSIPLEKEKRSILSNPIRWSNNGEYLAFGSEENVIQIYQTKTWELYKTIAISDNLPTKSDRKSSNNNNDLLWLPDNKTLLVASGDSAYKNVLGIDVWDIETSSLIKQLNGHTLSVLSLSLSADKTLVASKTNDSTVQFWRCSDWSNIATLPVMALGYGIAFHPHLPILALPYAEKEDGDFRIALWELEI